MLSFIATPPPLLGIDRNPEGRSILSDTTATVVNKLFVCVHGTDSLCRMSGSIRRPGSAGYPHHLPSGPQSFNWTQLRASGWHPGGGPQAARVFPFSFPSIQSQFAG